MSKGNKKKIIFILFPVVFLIFMLVFFATDLSSMVLESDEYEVYKYAKECVLSELSYPKTAKISSFKESEIKLSDNSANVIVKAYSLNKTFGNAWEVSGSGQSENKLGMKVNFTFVVTIGVTENGEYWCYECNIN